MPGAVELEDASPDDEDPGTPGEEDGNINDMGPMKSEELAPCALLDGWTEEDAVGPEADDDAATVPDDEDAREDA